jgi:hypothetical protein
MEYTENYNLKKPEAEDFYNIEDFNENMEIIDGELKNLEDNKVDKIPGKGLSTNDYTTEEKNKLAGIEAEANKYVHPSTHSADMIVENTNRRFISDEEKAIWKRSLRGIKWGLEIYYNGSEYRVKPGLININNGTDDVIIEKTAETSLGLGTIDKWNYVLIDDTGEITLESSVHAPAGRPHDSFFANYDYTRQGYYYSASKRIIGAIGMTSYPLPVGAWLINVFEGTDEEGKGYNGSWKRDKKMQTAMVMKLVNFNNYDSITRTIISVSSPVSFPGYASASWSTCFYTGEKGELSSVVLPNAHLQFYNNQWTLKSTAGYDYSGNVAFIAQGEWRD